MDYGILNPKGYFGTSYLLLSYTLNIDIKDGKIRYTLDILEDQIILLMIDLNLMAQEEKQKKY